MSKMRVLYVGVLACLLIAMSLCSANTINYGDFVGVNVKFLNIWEASSTNPGVALYGQPAYHGGDVLDFDNLFFGASASGNGGNDTVDGTLGGTIQAKPNHIIDTVRFEEFGDFTLSGFMNDAYVSVRNTVFIKVKEIDGIDVPDMTFNVDMIFTPKSSWYLSENKPFYSDDWSGVLYVDVMQGLIDKGFNITGTAVTELDFTMDNILVAMSMDGTSAVINKKEANGLRVTSFEVPIPEPATVALLCLGGIFLRRKR